MPNKLYRFSPIATEAQFEQAVAYVAEQAHALTKQITGKKLPLNTICICAHYPEEEQFLLDLLQSYGPKDEDASHNITVYVRPKQEPLAGEHVRFLGVRGVDPYRANVGYADFSVPNYQQFVTTYSGAQNGGLARPVAGREDVLFELWHPDFDVFAYIVND